MARRNRPAASPPAARASERLLTKWISRMAPQAVHLVTPVPSRIPLSKLKTSPGVCDFVRAYEPRAEQGGVYAHQARVLEALGAGRRDVVLTTATGSGKSLAFWAWAYDLLRRDTEATVIACFPTQALLWGQAERLRRASSPDSVIVRNEQAFAGEIKVGGGSVPWTVWYGTSGCNDMKAQEQSESFERARIRVCTFDKAHWSLMQPRHEYFLRGLAGIIADEGHVWQGLSGAHVRRMFDRLRVALDVLEVERPAFFVASATLPDAPRFAALLTGEQPEDFLAVDDGAAPRHALVATADVPALLRAAPGEEGLHRFVLMVRPDPEQLISKELLTDPEVMGTDIAALCFVCALFVTVGVLR